MKIEYLGKKEAEYFIKKYHYSKIMPRINKYYLGFYEKKELVGVVTLGYGTQPLQTIKKIFYKHNVLSKDYLEIGKMCFIPRMNDTKSFGSQVISMLVKWLKINLPEVSFLYTLADGIMGKVGYVYQASNFYYIGQFSTSVYMDRKTKEKIHPRSAKKLCEENAIYENKNKIFWLTHSFCEYKGIDKISGLMFRYVYPLSKKAKKMLYEYDEYINNKYPKENALVYKKRVLSGSFIKIDKPDFDMSVREHNHQKEDSNIKQYNIFDFMGEE